MVIHPGADSVCDRNRVALPTTRRPIAGMFRPARHGDRRDEKTHVVPSARLLALTRSLPRPGAMDALLATTTAPIIGFG